MTAIKDARKALAAELKRVLPVSIVYPNPVPETVDPPCVEIRPFEGEGGYISFIDERGTFCSPVVTLTARVMVARKGEDAEFDWLDDRADDLGRTFGSSSHNIVTVSPPRATSYGPIEVLYIDAEITVSL